MIWTQPIGCSLMWTSLRLVSIRSVDHRNTFLKLKLKRGDGSTKFFLFLYFHCLFLFSTSLICRASVISYWISWKKTYPTVVSFYKVLFSTLDHCQASNSKESACLYGAANVTTLMPLMLDSCCMQPSVV